MSDIYLAEIKKAIDEIPFGPSYRMFFYLYQALEEYIASRPFEAAEILKAIMDLADVEGRWQLLHEATLMWRNYPGLREATEAGDNEPQA